MMTQVCRTREQQRALDGGKLSGELLLEAKEFAETGQVTDQARFGSYNNYRRTSMKPRRSIASEYLPDLLGGCLPALGSIGMNWGAS